MRAGRAEVEEKGQRRGDKGPEPRGGQREQLRELGCPWTSGKSLLRDALRVRRPGQLGPTPFIIVPPWEHRSHVGPGGVVRSKQQSSPASCVPSSCSPPRALIQKFLHLRAADGAGTVAFGKRASSFSHKSGSQVPSVYRVAKALRFLPLLHPYNVWRPLGASSLEELSEQTVWKGPGTGKPEASSPEGCWWGGAWGGGGGGGGQWAKAGFLPSAQRSLAWVSPSWMVRACHWALLCSRPSQHVVLLIPCSGILVVYLLIYSCRDTKGHQTPATVKKRFCGQ